MQRPAAFEALLEPVERGDWTSIGPLRGGPVEVPVRGHALRCDPPVRGRNVLRGVLFDMDGTLTDSEEIWTGALHQMAVELGGRLSPNARAQMLGRPLGRVVEMLHAETGAGGDVAVTRRALLGMVEQSLERGVAWRPGALELVHAVRSAGLSTALVTSSPRRLVDIAMKDLLPHAFDVTICGEDVERPKPDPEPYLRALDLLRLDAHHCIAVEDSVPGALAAERARLPVLVVPSVEPVPATEARTVVATLRGQSVYSLSRMCFRHSVGSLGVDAPYGVVA